MSAEKAPQGYKEDFDPQIYLDTYYKPSDITKEEGHDLRFFLDSLHDIFASGNLTGEKLLDIGTGPSVYSVISASRHVTEIHLSDFADQNRAVLQEWLDGAPSIMHVFEYILKKEKNSTSLEARVNMVREKVKKIHEIDLFQEKPISGLYFQYDIITSSLCFEAVATTKKEFASFVVKVADMLKTGGFFVIMGDLNESFYRVGEFKFGCLALDTEDLNGIFTEAGFDIKEWQDITSESYKPPASVSKFADGNGLFITVLQKRDKN